jgi:uncharacterized membrane protein
VLGLVQFAAPKGTLPHRTIGWIWVALMAVVALSSFWIHRIGLVGPFSPIHLPWILPLAMLPLGIWWAHYHDVARHRRVMAATFTGALVIAGLLTLLPGRIMHTVVFGPERTIFEAIFWPAFSSLGGACSGPVSLWKNEGKNRFLELAKGGFKAPDTLYEFAILN